MRNVSGSVNALMYRTAAAAGLALSEASIRRLVEYLQLLERWNSRINLTGSVTWKNIEPLFGEALWAARFCPETAWRHLDLGSGNGFPALPLRILRPEMKLDLVESRVKRSVFLETVVRELSLTHTQVHNARAEEFVAAADDFGYDCISWKALRLTDNLLQLLLSRCRSGCRFWVFHGAQPCSAIKHVGEGGLALVRREPYPPKKNWFLSIYERH